MRGFRKWVGESGFLSYFLRRRRWVTLLVCVLVALLLWVMSSMNGTYTKRVQMRLQEPIEMPVRYTISDSARLPKVVAVDITASGSTLMKYSLETLFRKTPELNLRVDSLYLAEEGGRWAIAGTRLREEALASLPILARYYRDFSTTMEVVVYPSEIAFTYAPLTTRTIPVAFTSQVDFGENANFLLRSLSMEPDVARVYGLRADVDSLWSHQAVITTDTLPLRVEEEGISSYRVALSEPKGMKLDPDSVTVTVNVEELVYYSDHLSDLQVDNLPEGYSLRLFPFSIKVGYLAPRDSLVTSDAREPIELYVDAADIGPSSKVLNVYIRNFPSYAYTLQLEPDRVEFILEESEE